MRKQADKSAGHLALQLAWTLHKRQQVQHPHLSPPLPSTQKKAMKLWYIKDQREMCDP